MLIHHQWKRDEIFYISLDVTSSNFLQVFLSSRSQSILKAFQDLLIQDSSYSFSPKRSNDILSFPTAHVISIFPPYVFPFFLQPFRFLAHHQAWTVVSYHSSTTSFSYNIFFSASFFFQIFLGFITFIYTYKFHPTNPTPPNSESPPLVAFFLFVFVIVDPHLLN